MTIFYIILLILAAFPLLITIWKLKSVGNFKKQGVYTNAVITGITQKWSRGGKNFDLLTLEYRDSKTGKPYPGQSVSKLQKYKTGDTVEVIYLPQTPSKYILATKNPYRGMLIFSIVVLLFFIMAVYLLDGKIQSQQD